MTMKLEIKKLVVAIFLCELAGVIGSIFTMPSIGTWYASLSKPWFTPPSWLFGPVWLTLYLLMGVSLYLVWMKDNGSKHVKPAVIVFGVQLLLNTLWSFLFFGLRNPLYGFICIAAMWLAIVATIIKFYKVSRTAAMLLIPYIAWVTIAAALNYYVLILNP